MNKTKAKMRELIISHSQSGYNKTLLSVTFDIARAQVYPFNQIKSPHKF